MATEVTNGIKVSVKTEYLDAHSKPELRYYLFSYKIRIENTSGFPVQLLRRKWFIFDSVGECKEVEGEGVVGQQPVILPGESYEYESGCNLCSEIGNMHGHYVMKNKTDNNSFFTAIPKFELSTPYKRN